jgi:hypothetical protein
MAGAVSVGGALADELPVIDTIEQWCSGLAKDLKSVDRKRCLSRPWKVDARSNGQLIIPHFQWGDEQGRHIIIMGGIHGDEISSISLVFRWIDFIEQLPEGSELRKMRFLFMPILNPDGYWSRPRTRTNLMAVDLNRNFDTKGWREEAIKYWIAKTKKDKRRYPGHEPASEIETQYFQKVIAEYKPEIIISVHAPYGILDHDGKLDFPKNLKSPLPVKTLGSFPGSLGRYAGIDRKIPVITVELTEAKQMPGSKAVEDLLVFVLNSKAEGMQSIVR